MPTAKDYRKIAEEQEAHLQVVKEEFERQSARLDEMFEEAKAMGLDLEAKPDLNAMSEEERRVCLDFERRLNEVTSLMAPVEVRRPRSARRDRRSMV